MSHIIQIETEVRGAAAACSACRRLNLDEPILGTFTVFGTEATGLGVQLPDWRYPIVCDTTTGKIRYDNYSGAWGDQKELDRFTQAYAVEKCRLEARRKGHSLTEQLLADGSVKITVNVGEVA